MENLKEIVKEREIWGHSDVFSIFNTKKNFRSSFCVKNTFLAFKISSIKI